MADLYPLVNENYETIISRLRDSLSHYLPGVSSDPDTPLGRVLASYTAEFEKVYLNYADVASITLWRGAYGEFLDHKGIELGVARNQAKAATVRIRFEGTAGLVIPAGTEVSTNDTVSDPATFATSARLVLPSTGYAEVWAESLDQGSSGNVAADTVTVLDSDVPGVVMVTNESAASGGADVESDDSYAARLFAAWADSPTGTGSRSDYQRWAREAAPGIESAKVADPSSVPELTGITDQERYNLALGIVPIAPYPADRSRPTAEQLFRIQEYIDPGNLVIHSEMDGWVLPNGDIPSPVFQASGTGTALNRKTIPAPVASSATYVPTARFIFPYPRDLSKTFFSDSTMANNYTPMVGRLYAFYSGTFFAFRFIDTDGNYVTSPGAVGAGWSGVTARELTWTATGAFNPRAVAAVEILCQLVQAGNAIRVVSLTFLGRRADAPGKVPRNISCAVFPPQRLSFNVDLPTLTFRDPTLREETIVQIREKIIAEYGVAEVPNSATLTRIIASVPNVASVSSSGTVAAPTAAAVSESIESYDLERAQLLATSNIEVTVG